MRGLQTVLIVSISTFFVALGYTLKRNVIVNGHRYEETIIQPWFRVPHRPHIKLNETDDSDAPRGFGKHFVPAVYLTEPPPEWPAKGLPYYHCMDLLCICPFYNGTVINGECVLREGKLLQKAIRKEYRTYTREERKRFVAVMNEIKRSGLYTALGRIHKFHGVHSGPAFLTWHREFLKRLEISFRQFDPELALPYWDSTLDNNLPDPVDSIMWSEHLMGDTNDDDQVISGPWANWTTMEGSAHFNRSFYELPDGELFNEARIDFVLGAPRVEYVLTYSLPLEGCRNYSLDDRFLEFSHDYVHYFISGDMFERFSSSNDPIFFMHHAFVDLIWEMWRQQKQNRIERENDYPADDESCAPKYHFRNFPMPKLSPLKNKDGLSNKYTDYMYEYAPRPTCSLEDIDCSSEFLFCDTTDHSSPRCSAKVKLGGRCDGIKNINDVCYKGICDHGRCKKVDKKLVLADMYY